MLTNWAESGTVKNGSGGGAPARDESGLFTMERAFNSDRRSLWKSSSGAGTITFDLDLGAARGVRGVAALGLTSLPSADSGTFDVYYANTYFPGAWSSFGSAAWASGDRDVGVSLPAGVSRRYWRVVFTGTGTLTNVSLGRLYLGTYASYDLGGIHSPDGISSPFQNRIEQQMQDGSFNINTLGFPGRDFSFPFNQVTTTVRDQLMAIAAAAGTVVLVDAEDKFYECLVTGGRCGNARRTDTMFNVVLECRRLP